MKLLIEFSSASWLSIVLASLVVLASGSAFAQNKLGNQKPAALVTYEKDFTKYVVTGEGTALEKFDVNVSGVRGANHYQYKFGLLVDTDCSIQEGYSSRIDNSVGIHFDLSNISDGADVVLCLIGSKLRGEQVVDFQPLSLATSYQWVKNSVASAYPVARLKDRLLLLDIGDGESSRTQITSRIQGSNRANRYRFKFGTAGTVNCSESEGYSEYRRLKEKIDIDISGFSDGDVNLCLVAARMKSGEVVAEQPLTDATVYLWTKITGQDDTTPPGSFLILSPVNTVSTYNPLVTWEAADGMYYLCVTARNVEGGSVRANNNAVAFTVDTGGAMEHILFATSLGLVISSDSEFPPPSGSIGSLDGADWQCTQAAYDGGMLPDWNGLDLVYRALLSTSTVDARDRAIISGSVFNTNSELLATGADDLWGGRIVTAVAYNELGNLITGDYGVWTGSKGDGTKQTDNCSDWTDGSSDAIIGNVMLTGGRWFAGIISSCSNAARLYCLSPPIPVE